MASKDLAWFSFCFGVYTTRPEELPAVGVRDEKYVTLLRQANVICVSQYDCDAKQFLDDLETELSEPSEKTDDVRLYEIIKYRFGKICLIHHS